MWKIPLDKKECAGVIFMGLSKAFDSKCSLPNYIKKASLKLLFGFITNHWEEMKVDFYVS